jgi:excinuclease UvrABC nuclease subunit
VLNPENVQKDVLARPGVYRLSRRGDDGKYTVFYIGQATDLGARLLQHLGNDEKNECIRSKRAAVCGFRFIYVESQSDRDTMEGKQIEEYKPECNTQRP